MLKPIKNNKYLKLLLKIWNNIKIEFKYGHERQEYSFSEWSRNADRDKNAWKIGRL